MVYNAQHSSDRCAALTLRWRENWAASLESLISRANCRDALPCGGIVRRVCRLSRTVCRRSLRLPGDGLDWSNP